MRYSTSKACPLALSWAFNRASRARSSGCTRARNDSYSPSKPGGSTSKIRYSSADQRMALVAMSRLQLPSWATRWASVSCSFAAAAGQVPLHVGDNLDLSVIQIALEVGHSHAQGPRGGVGRDGFRGDVQAEFVRVQARFDKGDQNIK